IRYGGAFENLERASKRLSLVVPLALALIFMLVFFAVKSLKHTLMIYVAIPLAAVGGVFSLLIRGMPFSISAGVGFIVLFGVAVLNGLVLINGLNELKKEGILQLDEIIKKGSKRRIRPILLTASTDILGFLPMAISTSAGAEVQRPLATVVIGGMLTSTLLTLIVLPVLYRYVESGKKRLKTRKAIPSAAFAILLIAGLGISGETQAQDTTFSLQQAIDRAKLNYPSIEAARLEVEKQKAFKSASYDLGRTTIFTGKEEVGNSSLGTQNQIGIVQSDIDLFSIPAKNQLAQARTKQAISQQNLNEFTLIRDVSMAWYGAVSAKQQWELYKQLDTLYANFAKAAELRFKTQATSRIEYLSASAKYKELLVNIRKAESIYFASLQILNQYLIYPSEFEVDIKDVELHVYSISSVVDSLQGSPFIDLYAKGVDVALSNWKREKANYLPKLNLEYTKQAIEGVNGFYRWEAGISIPLLPFAQSGRTKVSKYDYQIAGKVFEQNKLEIVAGYNQQLSRYVTLRQVLEFYQQEALPLAEEQIQASTLAYNLGSIDYVQFIQNVEAAINTKQKFIIQQSEYFELSTSLKQLTGK
ncbi:MAG: CusA/CzcA family heavy metal efflux RND transporter, partial [Bacteroidetes bacterium]